MSRIVKFRAWDKARNEMYEPHTIHVNPTTRGFMSIRFNGDYGDDSILMQFTGKKCFNNKEVYEGDILFYEEHGDNGDEIFYIVVTWIEEWSMFATLHVEEYHKYLLGGAKELDEVLYWTYPIEESEDYHYAGNIYQNSELL